jgi:hypothetical protein
MIRNVDEIDFALGAQLVANSFNLNIRVKKGVLLLFLYR